MIEKKETRDMVFKSISIKHINKESFDGFPVYRIIHNKTGSGKLTDPVFYLMYFF